MIEHHLTKELRIRFPLQIEYILRDPLLFGDCRNAISANDQTRIYEDLIDYDSVFYLFQEVSIDKKLNLKRNKNILLISYRFYWSIRNIMVFSTWYYLMMH